MMVETPAKRLRILQSVEVDETNPDYIAAKHEQQQKFKSRLERIFDKYESMHESMSDEIDFRTGKVVVDRGHIRRVQRQLTRKGPTLVDNFLGSAPGEDNDLREHEEQAGSEDELAPTQTRKRKRNSVEGSNEGSQSTEQRYPAITATPQVVPTAIVHHHTHQIPVTSNPAASILEGIQFPQTPLGQQAQAVFVANLNQTIVQAVQQVVAPLFSILQNTPNTQASPAHFSVPPLQVPISDAVRPAADPKWYFPPISAAKEAPQIEPPKSSPPVINAAPSTITNNNDFSSPLVPRRRSPKVHIQKRPGALKRSRDSQTLEASVERPQSSHSLPETSIAINSCSTVKPTDQATQAQETRKPKWVRKYYFTEEDDAYISEKRKLHKMSFKEIQCSKAEWSEWPASAICNRWHNHLKGKKLDQRTASRSRLTAQNCLPTSEEQDEHFFSSIEIPETSSAEHRLPTPSSLEQEGKSIERTMVPSSSHFDDDELELLSLAGADVSDVQTRYTLDGEIDTSPGPDEPIASVEGAEFRDEDELQREMLKMEESPTPAPQLKILPSTIPETQESVLAASPPSQTHKVTEKPKPKPIATQRAHSNSSEDLDLIGANDEPATPRVYIKRESLTPQATRILCSSPVLKTPRPIPQSSGMAKSTGKLNRRAFLNDVKKGWAKANGKSSGSQKRRSLNVYPTEAKKAQIALGAGESEDELAV